MSNIRESAGKGPFKGALEGIEGEQIVKVEVHNGGHLYCDIIEMRLTGGKLLHFSRYLSINKYGIDPKIEYQVKNWFKCFTNGLNEDDCIGQQLFDFAHKS